MICENCDARMRCVYSAPAGARVRYRVYKCGCGGWLETTEVPSKMYVGGQDREAVGDLIGTAQRKRTAIIFRAKRPH